MSESKIGCGICRDLLPLVRDGVAGAESEAAVRAHAEECPDCAALLQGGRGAEPEPPCAPDDAAVLKKVRRKLGGAVLCLVALGALAGVGLTGGAGVFYNAAIMPLLGGAMYGFLREKGLLAAPLAVLLTLGWGALRWAAQPGTGELFGFLMYGVIYALLVLLGWLAAALLHCALKKGSGRPLWHRLGAGAAALALAVGLAGTYVQLNGEIFTRLWLTAQARSYVRQMYPEADYEAGFAVYSFKTGGYFSQVTSPSSPDTRFSVYREQGALTDSYEEFVASGRNTGERLRQELGDWAEATLRKKSGLELEFAFAEWATDEAPRVELDQLLRLDRLPAPFELTVWVVSDRADRWEELADTLLALDEVMQAEGVRPAAYSVLLRWPSGADGQPLRYDGLSVYELPAELLDAPPAAGLPAALKSRQAQWERAQEKK